LRIAAAFACGFGGEWLVDDGDVWKITPLAKKVRCASSAAFLAFAEMPGGSWPAEVMFGRNVPD